MSSIPPEKSGTWHYLGYMRREQAGTNINDVCECSPGPRQRFRAQLGLSRKPGRKYFQSIFLPPASQPVPRMNEAVVIEQAAALTSLGDIAHSVEALLGGKSALRPGPCFDVPTAYAPFANCKDRDLRTCARLLGSNIDLDGLPAGRMIFIYCSAKGDIHSLEDVVSERTSRVDVSPLLDAQAQQACRLLGLQPDRIVSISNACASGAIAVELAKELLEDRRFSHAVLFGLESLCRFVATGFHALSALSPTGARPFDAARDGLSLGEAAGVAVLSFREPRPGDMVVAGAGSSNDANHRTGPSRTGEGLHSAACAALADAGIDPRSIGAVKCHGTATPYNDAMEAKAIYRLFGDTCPPCASLKGAIGHTSGAGSLVEMLLAAEFLKQRGLPPTSGYERHGVDEPIPVSNRPQPISGTSILCLSAGFGGVNAGIVVQEAGA
ncbi:MAG: hypothetical protein GF418_14515 [Chitinivibrionales bacterium]|nr:hypothetical protein [Chitinivibrionales bacterium]MBD3396834.1 hypothetical protein [Chitinivibrionales bacterium]